MTDFGAAFRAGQTAAAKAQRAKEQITEVLEAVARDLTEATEGKLTIYEAELGSFATTVFAAAQSLNTLSGKTDPAPIKERSIFAKNLLAIDSSSIRLARWSVPHSGFPCILGYSGQDVRCHDRSGLEAAFVDLLKDAWVGDQLGRLLARETSDSIQFEDDVDNAS
ncbi:MAG: hypothetical protein QM749_15915 [Aquabacterium sp.]